MRNRLLVGTFASVSLMTATPVSARSLWDGQPTASAAVQWEAGYLALSAIDAAQTLECLHRDVCEEGNPIFGKHPGTRKVIIGKLLVGTAQFAFFKHVYDIDSRSALRFAQASVVMQGGVVGLNARFAFH